MRKPTTRLPSPYRPDPAPHTWRTALIVGFCLLAIVLILAWMIGTDLAWNVPADIRPVETGGGYDPGLYTPFTQAPVPR
jgi:hypothetical protein